MHNQNHTNLRIRKSGKPKSRGSVTRESGEPNVRKSRKRKQRLLVRRTQISSNYGCVILSIQQQSALHLECRENTKISGFPDSRTHGFWIFRLVDSWMTWILIWGWALKERNSIMSFKISLPLECHESTKRLMREWLCEPPGSIHRHKPG